jgi:hypothetical protein
MNEALGLIETVGLAAAIEAADTAVKAANVKLLGYEKTRGNGMIMVKIVGGVGAVKAAVTAGVMAANRVNEVYSYHVIARPHDEIEALIANVDRGPGRGHGAPEGVIPPPPPPAPAFPEPYDAPAFLALEAPAAVAEEVIAVPVEEAVLPVEGVAAAEPEVEEEPAAVRRCAAFTHAGTRCRNRVVAGTHYCRQHQPKETRTAFEEEA